MILALAILLFVIGLLMSAFFSGAETGLYRVTRVRLVIDALSGDRIARGLLWMTNHPSVFVATVLVGNNLANNLVSLGIVIAAEGHLPVWGVLAPILFSPIVFVLGESMPKTVFYESPNRLLRRCGPILLSASILFAPIIAVLWLVSRGLEWIVGESPQRLRLGLARRELAQVLEEGHEAGILRPSQRALASGLFAMASRPVGEFVLPAARMIRATTAMSKREILRIARRHRLTVMPVEETTGRRRVVGYLRVVDLYLDESDRVPIPRSLLDIRASDQFLGSLMRLQKEAASLGRVIDDEGHTVGYVTARHLSKLLFRGQ